jgi:hypothetical protein
MSKEERVIPVRTSRVLDIVVGGGAELVTVTGAMWRLVVEMRKTGVGKAEPRCLGNSGVETRA